METTGQKIRIRYITFLFIFFISSCFNSNEPRGAYWNGQANFMHVTKESMTMTYSVDITGQKVYLEGFYEVIKKNTDKVIFRIKVEELEFGNREDGRNFCRVWGSINNTEIQSYLFALDCLPIE